MARITSEVTTSIANGAALSSAVNTADHEYGIILMPAAWTAASIGFQISYDNSTYYKLYDHDGNLLQVDSPAASGAYQIPNAAMTARYMKLWSQNGSGTNTNQAAARTVKLLLKS